MELCFGTTSHKEKKSQSQLTKARGSEQAAYLDLEEDFVVAGSRRNYDEELWLEPSLKLFRLELLRPVGRAMWKKRGGDFFRGRGGRRRGFYRRGGGLRRERTGMSKGPLGFAGWEQTAVVVRALAWSQPGGLHEVVVAAGRLLWQ